MFCTNCGSQFEEGNAFCPNCGAKVESVAQRVEAPAPVAEPIAEPVPVAAPVEAAPVAAIPVATPVEPAYQATPAYQPAPAPAPQPQAVPVAPVQPVYAQPQSVPVTPMGGPITDDPELAKSVMIMGIMSIAFACSFFLSFLGIIFGAIGLNKAKQFTEKAGQLFGKARIGKYLSLGGLIGACCVTAYFAFWFLMIILAAISEMN